jgi:serine protease Do
MFKTSYLPAVIFGAVTTMMVQSQPVFASLSADQIADIAEKITVRILTPGSPGSGIIIGKNGNTYQVLTSRHVIESINSGEQGDIQTFDGELHSLNTANIKTFGENWDLAVVEFTSDKSYQVGQMGDSSTLKRGQMVYVAGFSIATAAMNISLLNFTKGNLTAVASRPFDDGYGLVYDNNTLPGMSGGVVLDENGMIIGVHGKADAENAKGTDDPSIRVKTGFNMAIPINSYLSLTNQIAFKPNVNQNSAMTADDYYTQGNQKYEQKDYQGAISLFNQAIALNSNYADAYIDRGRSYNNLKRYQEASQRAGFACPPILTRQLALIPT